MPDSILLAVAVLVSACGIAWFALSMRVHWKQVSGEAAVSLATTRTLRVLGAVALISSLFLCLSADHGSIAVLVWVMSLAASALAIAFTLSWRPAVLGWLVPWKIRERRSYKHTRAVSKTSA